MLSIWFILMMYPSYYLSVHYLAEKVCWRKGKSNGCVSSLRCFSCLSLFCSWLVFISGKDWSLVSDSFLLCLLLLYPIVFSTLIDICKEDKADSLVYLIKRNIWLLSKRQGVSVVFMPLYGLFWCIQHDFTHCITVSRAAICHSILLKRKENDFKWRKYVQVGLGGRARFYETIASTYHQTCELVGFVMYLKQGWIMQIGYLWTSMDRKVKTCMPSQFEQLLDDVRPAEVIITSVDRTHHDYIIRAMKRIWCYLRKTSDYRWGKAQEIITVQNRREEACESLLIIVMHRITRR